MFGNAGQATWGTSQWGTVSPEPGKLFTLDGLTLGTFDRGFTIDALVATPNLERFFLVDALARGDFTRSFAVDFYPQPLDPAVWNTEELQPYVLIELLLPAGPVRIATQCVTALGFQWDERVVSAGSVLRTVGRGTDDVIVTLDDTNTDGQVRFRDLFAANAPEASFANVYLGARGAADSEVLLVFPGRIEQVIGFTYDQVRLRLIRREAVEDRLLGDLIDLATFPNAPEQSVGSMLPVVFGTRQAHEGVVTATAKVTTLAQEIPAAFQVLITTELSLFDAGWPISGSVEVNGEQMTYTGLSGGNLAGVTRGVNGTIAVDHPAGAEVVLLTGFNVRVAGHPTAEIKNVKVLLPSGRLGDPVPQPTAILPNIGELQWDAIPAISDPQASSVFQRVHFNAPGPFNNVPTADFAARESSKYGAFQSAEGFQGQLLELLTNAADLGQPGDIERVWLGAIFDPANLGAVRVQVDNVTFNLQATDLVPNEIARNDEKTGDRLFEVTPPQIDVAPQPTSTVTIHPETVLVPGIWAYPSIAKNVVDKDEDTEAVYIFNSAGEAQIIGGGDAVFQVPPGYTNPVPSGADVSNARIIFIAGWTNTPLTAHFEVWLRNVNTGEEIPGTRFTAQSTNAAGFGTQSIIGREVFEHPIPGAVAASITEDVQWVVHPALGVANGIWVGVELFIQADVTPGAPDLTIDQSVEKTVTNYFELTDRLGVSASPGGAVIRDWAFFSDFLRGGRVNFTFLANLDTSLPIKIVETFYVVQYRPFVQASTPTPRVFADVAGLVPSGDPVEIARALVTNLPPLGLGLPAARVDQESYNAAQASLQADGIRADFAVRQQVSVLELLSDLAEQTDCRETWLDGVHRILRFPSPDTPLPTVTTIVDNDLFTDRPLSIAKTSMREVRNVVDATWRTYDPTGEASETTTLQNAPSQVTFGIQKIAERYDLIADTPTANAVAGAKLLRMAQPRWVVEFEIPLYGYNLRLGDLIAMSHRDFTFAVAEVTQVNLVTAGLKKIQVQAIVWSK